MALKDSAEVLVCLFTKKFRNNTKGLRASLYREIHSETVISMQYMKNMKQADASFKFRVSEANRLNCSWNYDLSGEFGIVEIDYWLEIIHGVSLPFDSNNSILELKDNWVSDGTNSSITKFGKIFYYQTSGLDFIAPWTVRKIQDSNNNWTLPQIETARQNETEHSEAEKGLYFFFSGREWSN